MTLFDKMYAASADVVNDMNKPFRQKMLLRVAERVADNLETERLSYEQKRNNLLHSLVNCGNEDQAVQIYSKIAGLSIEMDVATSLVKSVMETKKALFEEEVK